jgi:hypothetical protein
MFLASTAVAAERIQDERLAQKVTVISTGQSLGSFLTGLSIKTGVKMTARDEVADHKLVVFAADMPLSEVMAAISEVFHVRQTASAGSEGKPEYEFCEEESTSKEIERLKREKGNEIARQVDHAAEVLKLPEEEIQKKLKEDALLRPLIGDRSFRTVVEVYRLLDEKSRAQLWDSGVTSVKPESLPKKVADDVQFVFKEGRKHQEAEGKKLTGSLKTIFFEFQDDPMAGQALRFNLTGTDNVGVTMIMIPSLANPADLVGNPDLFELKEERDANDPEAPPLYRSVAKKLEGRLAEKSKIEFTEFITMLDAVRRIHDDEKLNIVSDYFTAKWNFSGPAGDQSLAQGDTLAHTFEKMVGVFQYNWKMLGDTVLLTSERWYLDRDMEVPHVLVQRWLDARHRKGAFDLNDMVEMSTLSLKQIRTLSYYGLYGGQPVLENVHALRLISTMDPGQRRSAESDEGLPVSMLAESQKPLLEQWATAPVGEDRAVSQFVGADLSKVVIRIVTPEPNVYTFRLDLPSGPSREDVLRMQ